jgi:DNA-binding NarL/FixJ family response regulator
MAEDPTMTTPAESLPPGQGDRTRVLVVDDHAPLRRLIVEVLEEAGDIAVVGECSDGEEVVDAFLRTRPDVVLMDVNMPGTDGIEATRRLLAVEPGARVVLLTASSGADRSENARRLGGAGCLSKADVGALPDRVRAVASGGTAWG